jgi:hypothetical protein
MAINQTNANDFNAGRADKKAGYYDKWYRWNRKDDGQAYDAGFNSVECVKDEVAIIECMHSMEHAPTLEEKLLRYL